MTDVLLAGDYSLNLALDIPMTRNDCFCGPINFYRQTISNKIPTELLLLNFELPESLVMFMQLSGKVRKKSDARIDYRAN